MAMRIDESSGPVAKIESNKLKLFTNQYVETCTDLF